MEPQRVKREAFSQSSQLWARKHLEGQAHSVQAEIDFCFRPQTRLYQALPKTCPVHRLSVPYGINSVSSEAFTIK